MKFIIFQSDKLRDLRKRSICGIVVLILVSMEAIQVGVGFISTRSSTNRLDEIPRRTYAKIPSAAPFQHSRATGHPHASDSARTSEGIASGEVMPRAKLGTPTEESRTAVRNLIALVDSRGEPVHADLAAEWNRHLKELVEEGRSAIPAIVEFLKLNKDVDFSSEIRDVLKNASVRRALFNILSEIGGPEGVIGIQEVLKYTADPVEIALLSRDLENLEPDRHRAEALQAARESLAMAGSGKLAESDVAPLFEVIQKFGGSNVVADLENAVNDWQHYATIALGQLPDRAGIPALIRLAEGQGELKLAALQVLAGAAAESSEARTALLEQTRQSKISALSWPYLVSGLSGDEFRFQNPALGVGYQIESKGGQVVHNRFSNENFGSSPNLNLTAEQISDRLVFVDELESATSEPAAIQALSIARDVLTRRQIQIVALSR